MDLQIQLKFAFKHGDREAISFQRGHCSHEVLVHKISMLDGTRLLRSGPKLACLLDLADECEAHR